MEKENKPNNEGQYWRNLWRLLQPIRKGLLGISVFVIFLTLLAVVKPYALKLIVDRLTTAGFQDWGWLILWVMIFWGTDLIRTSLQYFERQLLFKVMVELEYFLPIKAHEKLLQLNLSYHERENTGAKIVKIEKGVFKISNLVGDFFFEVVPTVIQLFVTTIFLGVIDYRFAIGFLIFTIPFIILNYTFNRRLYPVRRARYRQYEKASGKMAQAVMNINAVQSFSQERRELRDFTNLKQDIKTKEDKEWLTVNRLNWFRNSLIDTGRAVVLILSAYLVFKGEISIGSLVFVMSLSESAYTAIYRLSHVYDMMAEGREGVSRLQELIEEKPEITNPENGRKLKNISGEIEFSNVSFNYRANENAVLKKINLKIAAGAVTALVGPSGSGKTTLARLIYRHYDPTTGDISVDGHSLRELDLYNYRRFLAIVPQEVEIFDLNIKDNIAYANPRASLKEIKAAAKMANAEEFIVKLNKGYETLVGERGVKLSGGQRQRIGIARAILANPQILIFDEATSNLDSYSEKLIQEAIERVRQHRTMIIVAHRLSTIRKADKIVVLENGRVMEEGSHLELSQHGGLYQKLLSLQATGDIVNK